LLVAPLIAVVLGWPLALLAGSSLIAVALSLSRSAGHLPHSLAVPSHMPSSYCRSDGDGPKMVDFHQMRETHSFQNRITLLGPVAHRDVPSVPTCHFDPSSSFLTRRCTGSSSGLYLSEYISHGSVWYRNIGSRMCRLACGLYLRWRRARNTPRRHDFIY
jgi:hypothetical protein